MKDEENDLSTFVFLDIKYIELSIGYTYLFSGKEKLTGTGYADFSYDYDDMKINYFDMAAMAKFPIKLGRTITLFPLLGINYKLNLVCEDDGTDVKASLSSDEKKSLNQLWIKGGIGMDININKIFIRPSMTMGYRFKTKQIKNSISALEDMGASAKYTALGFDFSVGVGYTF